MWEKFEDFVIYFAFSIIAMTSLVYFMAAYYLLNGGGVYAGLCKSLVLSSFYAVFWELVGALIFMVVVLFVHNRIYTIK